MVTGLKKIVILAGSPALVGLGIAILFGILDFIALSLWIGIEGYNYSMSSMMGVQSYALLLMLPALAGVAAAISYHRLGGGAYPLTSALSGFIAGFVLGTLSIAVAVLNIVLRTPDLRNISISILLGTMFQPGSILMVCVSAFISAACAFVYLYILKSLESDGTVDGRRIEKENRMVLSAAALLILAVALLPQALIFIGIDTGQIHESHSWYAVNVSVTRQGNGSVMLTNMGGQDGHLLDTGRPFIVSIAGCDATTADAIRLSGLRLSIDPATGLGRENGSSVVYSGADLATGGDGKRMVVVGIFPDGQQQALFMGDI